MNAARHMSLPNRGQSSRAIYLSTAFRLVDHSIAVILKVRITT